MKTLCLFLVAMSLGSYAQANQFEKLLSLYNAGSIVTQADLVGMNAGRCYRRSTPDLPAPGVLAGVTDDRHGPLDKLFKIVIQTHENAAPSYYENLTPEQLVNLESAISNSLNEIGEAAIIDNSLASTYLGGNAQYRTRKNGPYLVVRLTLINDRKDGSLKAGEAYMACYFFKKIK